ncbi:hypothetical protein [Antrihabitans stalactiti]|uniref:Uncharacterized protein n=1 Tax=Antrihabitans stalactiti TaxID=2584121 RepID=A0A848KC93_9NOCA|nr:hypothetical protein [Antrihabitans stalactiti]NMN95921.1 hypothetical protein [Antrihabitans stalactiti]
MSHHGQAGSAASRRWSAWPAGPQVRRSWSRCGAGEVGETRPNFTRAQRSDAERLGHSKGVLMKAGQILSFSALSGDGETQPLFQRALQMGELEAAFWRAEV